jgi:hypothetical protein
MNENFLYMIFLWKENTMKKIILVFMVIGASMIFFGCQQDPALTPELGQSDQGVNSLAKKPSPNLKGYGVTMFDIANGPFYWEGTMNFDGYDGAYGIIFESLEAPREYSQASPYAENFWIYKKDTDFTNPENVYLKGWVEGVVTNANNPPDDPSKFLSNGKIEEAYGEFEMWQGRTIHFRGFVYWNPDGLPHHAEGPVRIN